MATLQGARFLEEQLESITRQARLPDELVIGDDRSSDDTVAIIEAFGRRAPFPVVLQVNDRRLGSARNFEAAIHRCSGDAIALADQDDVWHPSKLERIQRVLAEPREPGLTFSDCELIDESSRPLGSTGWREVKLTARDRRAIDHGDAFRTLLERQHRLGGTVTGATMAFRAQYRELVLPFPELLPASGKGLLHDAWIALLVSAVAPVEIIPTSLVQYRQHPDQQIGMARPRPSSTGNAATAGPASFESSRQWLRALLDRLERGVGGPRRDEAIALLKRFTGHLDIRAGLSGRRLRRLSPVARELVAGRYHTYSSGFRSATRDLIG